jgi:Ca-activated chloride channel family protein
VNFEYPELLWYLISLPLGGVILLFAVRRSLRTIEEITGEYRRKEIHAINVVRYFVSGVLTFGAIASLIVALAEPVWGERSVEDERRGLELVFVIDVSNSMRAEDIDPSRLARARSVARSIAGRFPDAHKSVVIFKGAATVLVPMTEDPVSFDLAMNNLSGALITTAGTNIRDGLTAALDAFPPGSPRHRGILLFTDGEELLESVDAVVERIRREEIPIFAVQTGTEGGATIPLPSGGVLRDGDGEPVIAGVDSAVLRTLAAVSGGRFYRIADSGVTQSLVDDLEGATGVAQEILFRRTGENRYHLFVLLALVFLAGTVFVRSVPWGRKRGAE